MERSSGAHVHGKNWIEHSLQKAGICCIHFPYFTLEFRYSGGSQFCYCMLLTLSVPLFYDIYE
jgi:hypothetical protein